MACINPTILCVLLILLTIQQILHPAVTFNNVHATVNCELVGIDQGILTYGRYMLREFKLKFSVLLKAYGKYTKNSKK